MNLDEYKAQEFDSIGVARDAMQRRGAVLGATDLYPDAITSGSKGFARGLMPLAMLALLYDKVVVFIPAVTEELLEARLGCDLELVFDLSRHGIVDIVIGRPDQYLGEEYFESLIQAGPYSLWMRGLAVLEVLGMQEVLIPERCPLPVNEMASMPALINRYRKKYPYKSDIELFHSASSDIILNYADMCIFGMGDVAVGLAESLSPMDIYEDLSLANEMFTYPHLLVMGGTVNYDMQTLSTEPELLSSRRLEIGAGGAAVYVPELELLTKGLGFDVRSLKVEDIVSFRASGVSAALRSAVSDFEISATAGASGDGLTDAVGKAQRMQGLMRETFRYFRDGSGVKDMDRYESGVRGVVRAGSMAVGGILGGMQSPGLVIPWLAGFKVISDVISDPIVDFVMRKRFSPPIANVWRLSRSVRCVE